MQSVTFSYVNRILIFIKFLAYTKHKHTCHFASYNTAFAYTLPKEDCRTNNVEADNLGLPRKWHHIIMYGCTSVRPNIVFLLPLPRFFCNR